MMMAKFCDRPSHPIKERLPLHSTSSDCPYHSTSSDRPYHCHQSAIAPISPTAIGCAMPLANAPLILPIAIGEI